MPSALEAYPWIADKFEIAKEQPGGHYVAAFCPLKNHRSGATFRLWVGTKGNLLFGCWAGCTPMGTSGPAAGTNGGSKVEVLRACGFTWKDTYPENQNWKEVRGDITARYPYFDEKGVLLYETLRLEPGRGGRDKDFRQRRPIGGGRWKWDLEGVRRVLYRLPELVKPEWQHRTVFVVAGEKDADNLAHIGCLATTNVCGERSPWIDEYSETLRGREVIVIEDRDIAGKQHAHEVAGSLMAFGARSIRRAALPEKDATAYLASLYKAGVEDAAELRQAIQLSLHDVPKWRACK